MTSKYILRHEAGELRIEDFGFALLCQGRVFLREKRIHRINTSPGQCWGEYIQVPAGAFVDGEYSPRPCELCIDDIGLSHTVTIVESFSPLLISSVTHVGGEYCPGEEESENEYLSYREENGGIVITDFPENSKELLIPCRYKGLTVIGADLRECSMEKVETLIISENVRELALDFSDAYALRRFEFPAEPTLLCPINGISSTDWFRAKPHEPLYIADCYCGTPGRGSGGVRSLVIPEGIQSVADGADFHCYWHSIKTPSTLRVIGRMAFATCHCLEELNLSEGLEKIEFGAFSECNRLKSLYLPTSLRSLGGICFDRAVMLHEISIPRESFAEHFFHRRLILRTDEGEKLLQDCPPIVIPITDRVSAWPEGAPFTAAGRTYKCLSELSAHRLSWEDYSYLDVHGRKAWLIAAYDDGMMGIVQRRYIKEGDTVTQVELIVDGTVLVRDGIGILDVPHALRNIAAKVIFGLDTQEKS